MLLSGASFDFAAACGVLLFVNFTAAQYDTGRSGTVSLLAEGGVVDPWPLGGTGTSLQKCRWLCLFRKGVSITVDQNTHLMLQSC